MVKVWFWYVSLCNTVRNTSRYDPRMLTFSTGMLGSLGRTAAQTLSALMCKRHNAGTICTRSWLDRPRWRAAVQPPKGCHDLSGAVMWNGRAVHQAASVAHAQAAAATGGAPVFETWHGRSATCRRKNLGSFD